MANYFARKAGNIDATDVWATTPSGTAADVWSTFTSSDVLHSNSFTVTVNVSTTVGEVRTDNANGATNGGVFNLQNDVTLTANVFTGTSASFLGAVVYSGTGGNSASIVGNILGGTAGNAFGVGFNSTGTLNITGNVTGGSGAPSHGIRFTGSGIINITGNVTGGSGAGSFGTNCGSTGTINITGNVTGGSVSAANGADNTSTGTTNIVGVASASATAIGANNASTGTLTATRAVGNAFGIGAAGGTELRAGVVSVNISSDTRVEELEYGANGQAPTSGAVRIVSGTNNKCLVTLTTSAVKTLADPSDGTGQANEADVRSGTSYALGNKTGTCAVPAAGSVALGVPVDNTTGTAVLTPAAVWDALTSGMTTAGSIGARLKNAATLDSTGQQLADALSPVP
jgi:hypothetical protein